MTGSGPKHGKSYYVFWKGIFFVCIFTAMALLYLATQKVDYVWRWYAVPQYFFYEADMEFRAEIAGEIASINDQGENIVLVIQGDGESQQIAIPKSGNFEVDQGTIVFAGDVIGSYKQWKVGILMEGLWLTLKVSLIAIVFGIMFGLATGLARISDNPALKWGAITYIELIRGSPLLVQIFIWYFVGGTLVNNLLTKQGLSAIPPIWFGVASLAIFAGAYVAEIVRAGIQSISRGQMEAARSLGMTTSKAMRHIILPQAFKRILPPLAGQFISLIKDSSLLGIIAIRELTKATREVVTTSLQPFELWFVCALLYLILTFALSMFVQYLERRTVKS